MAGKKKSEKILVQRHSTLDFAKSYTSLFYGAVTVVLLIVLVFVGVRFIGQKNKEVISNEGANTAEDNKKMYTVVEGDTLWSIAEKYYESGFEWSQIAKANKIENPANIEKGVKLVIPDVEKKVVSEEKTEVNRADNTSVAKIQGEKYTVKSGDNLWDVAVRAYGDGFKWVEIAKANKLINPNTIHSGNNLIIPR